MSGFKIAFSDWKHSTDNSSQHKQWEPLSVEQGSKAQEVIFTGEFTAKQTAGEESWLQCLLQVHKGDSH